MSLWCIDDKHVRPRLVVYRLRLVLLVGVLFVCGAIASVVPPVGWACENKSLRVGASAGLPDCRAYEMVTPANKSNSSQDLDPHGSIEAVAGIDGNRVALQAFLTTFGETPLTYGSLSVFERTSEGWKTVSVPPANVGSAEYFAQIFNPALSQVGILSEVPRSPGLTFQVGVPGGPFSAFPTVAREFEGSGSHTDGPSLLLGATPDFSQVILASTDHTLLSPVPTGTDEQAYDLYELAGGRVRLVNVSDGGSVIGKCGATLGGGVANLTSLGPEEPQPDLARNAVSADGSKVFFTSPDPLGEGEDCPGARSQLEKTEVNPPQLYMRVTEVKGGVEEGRTVEVSAPQGVARSTVEEEEESKMPVYYGGASVDGSRVFFTTERALTRGAAINHPHLYEYDTQVSEGERLKLIFQGALREDPGVGRESEAEEVFVSADGSVVYFYRGGFTMLYRYEAANGGSVQQIATMQPPLGSEPPQTTPNGEFFMFASKGVTGEPRGAGHNEIYRYDHATGSVTCVSCGPGAGPVLGNSFTGGDPLGAGEFGYAQILTPDQMPEVTLISSDGGQVFFESEAALTPQVANVGVLNVYEWEADGVGSCGEAGGCTYLISQGNNPREALLIGASEDGGNVFFMTHAQLVPQDIDSSFNIYDARVNGGFPAPSELAACLGDTCLTPPVAPAAPPLATAGVLPGNPGPQPVVSSSPPKACRRGWTRRRGRCVKHRRDGRTLRSLRHTDVHDRGGGR